MISGNSRLFYFSLALIFLIFGLLGRFLTEQTGFWVWTHFILAALLLLRAIPGRFERSKSRTQKLSWTAIVRSFVPKLTVLCVILLLNYLAFSSQLRLDLSQQGLRSLSPASQKLLQGLNQPVEFFVVKLSDSALTYKHQAIAELYKQAADAYITVSQIDPLQQPSLAKKLSMAAGDLMVLRNQSGNVVRLNTVAEPTISAALNRLLDGKRTELWYLEGFGEPRLNDSGPEGLLGLNNLLLQENIELKGLALADDHSIPDAVQSILIVAPQQNLSAQTIASLDGLLKRGGHLIIFDEPDSASGLNRLVSNYGIQFESAVALDFDAGDASGQSASWQLSISTFSQHPITENLGREDLVTLLYAAPLATDATLQKAGRVQPLLLGSTTGWGETDLLSLSLPEPIAEEDESVDLKGPLTLGAVYQNEGGSKLLVFGDATWISNHNFNFYSNSKLAVQALKWTVANSSKLESAGVTARAPLILLSRRDFRSMVLWACLLPELILLAGLVIWWRRQRLVPAYAN